MARETGRRAPVPHEVSAVLAVWFAGTALAQVARVGDLAVMHLDEPPNRERHSNPMNISFAITGIDDIKEAQGAISAYIDLQFLWRDPRIVDAVSRQVTWECEQLLQDIASYRSMAEQRSQIWQQSYECTWSRDSFASIDDHAASANFRTSDDGCSYSQGWYRECERHGLSPYLTSRRLQQGSAQGGGGPGGGSSSTGGGQGPSARDLLDWGSCCSRVAHEYRTVSTCRSSEEARYDTDCRVRGSRELFMLSQLRGTHTRWTSVLKTVAELTLQGQLNGTLAHTATGQDTRALAEQAIAQMTPWTPVVENLNHLDADHSMTNAPVWFTPIHNLDDPVLSAVWHDDKLTTFKTSFDYANFPFDHQPLELCLELGQEMLPVLLPLFRDHDGHYLPYSRLGEHRTKEEFVPWDAGNPFLSTKAVDDIVAKGFKVWRVTPRVKYFGASTDVCIEIQVTRDTSVVILRFFGPVIMLTVTPFAGLYIPVTQVMPRIATGFVSFLALQVYRSAAYSLIPKKSNFVMFMDALMFSVNEILFLVVLENVLAQRLYAKYSLFAADDVDHISRWLFPICSFIIFALLFCMGVYNEELGVTPPFVLVYVQVIVVVGIAVCLARVAHFVHNLPRILMTTLVNQMNSGSILWRGLTVLDAREMSRLYQYIDLDRSGSLSPNEIVDCLVKHGLKLDTDQEQKDLLRHIKQECGTTIALEDFRKHFGDIFGREISHRIYQSNSRLNLGEEHEKEKPWPPGVQVQDGTRWV